ncbi:MAG TPA: hypothetical protein VLC09_11575 [Polyangiaceae bacterium]|nr:hypothetical protein [Polyangiaceae bacterium]
MFHPTRTTNTFLWTGLLLSLGAGCATDVAPTAETSFEGAAGPLNTQTIESQAQATAACNQDPRVWSGLVPLQICVGARLFFDETFGGNGRTCGSCHPAGNNFTIDQPFLASLDATDPLFVNEAVPALADLETTALRSHELIRENVDDFEDNENKFVLRSVPHLFGLSTTLERDPADGTSSAFTQRTGWSGDGVDGGALRDFANGAIKQHFPTNLERVPGRDFRLATASELDQLAAFQLALGRTNDLDLTRVVLSDPFAEQGRKDFLDPQVGRCNECHRDAGGRSVQTGRNTNFANGIEVFAPINLPRPTFDGVELHDGGFGGQGLDTPNVIAGLFEEPNAFGDNTFNTPSLIEVADTSPFFHHNGISDPEPTRGLAGAVAFYGSDAFNDSPAGQELVARFGSRVTLPGLAIINIQQFLRVLNVAFNLDLGKQRLAAAELLNVQYWNYREDIQRGLIELARREVQDARKLLIANDAPPLHTDKHAAIIALDDTLGAALAATNPADRLAQVRSALSQTAALRPAFGTNLNYNLGKGTLMF